MEAAKDLKEKRKHPRFKMEMPIEYRVLDTPHLHGALVMDVSESGLLVHSVEDLPIGAKLDIAVLFSKGLEFSDFKVLAEIVWKDVHWQDNRQGYKFGLKFVNIAEMDSWKLKELLGNGDER